MRKDLAIRLKARADEIASNFSKPDRERNFNKETFDVAEIRPLSDTTATVIFRKNTGKLALAFLYWLNATGGRWEYFFPTDSHVAGMESIRPLLQEIERANYLISIQP